MVWNMSNFYSDSITVCNPIILKITLVNKKPFTIIIHVKETKKIFCLYRVREKNHTTQKIECIEKNTFRTK